MGVRICVRLGDADVIRLRSLFGIPVYTTTAFIGEKRAKLRYFSSTSPSSSSAPASPAWTLEVFSSHLTSLSEVCSDKDGNAAGQPVEGYT
jgi:hypothetical protein